MNLDLEKLIKSYDTDTCIICHKFPDFIGLFAPTNSVDWGGYTRKQRFIRYCFCNECSKMDGFLEFVEFIISNRFRNGELTQ